tara:strand:+ start:653 stop:814 length:162 start_codon:yes stop_codon:yes gene_type:complete
VVVEEHLTMRTAQEWEIKVVMVVQVAVIHHQMEIHLVDLVVMEKNMALVLLDL